MLNPGCGNPHIFPACGCCKNSCNAVSADRCLCVKPYKKQYARAYITDQRYENITAPECALVNGTVFNDLYMPYVPCECECLKEKGCR